MAETLTVAELSALLGVSKVAVQGRIKRGTLVAEKVSGRYQIAKSEADRLLAANVGDNLVDEAKSPAVTGQPGDSELRQKPTDTNVGDNVGAHVGDNVGAHVGDNVGDPEEVERLRHELDASRREGELAEDTWRQKVDALDGANEALRRDAEFGERELEAMRENLQDARGEVGHLRSLSMSQAVSINALTAEVQGLTAMVHTRQMLDVPPDEESVGAEKPSRWSRWFSSGRRKRQQVRIGHA
jgi:hypothetical protein